MKRAALSFVLFFGVWLLWSGHTDPLLVGLGVLASGLCVWLGRRLGVLDAEGYPLHLGARLLTFIPWIVWQIVKANFDVARIILSPRLPIQPHLVRVGASQKTSLGQVIHANTITITPGTVSLDLREGTILVHALTRAAEAADEEQRIDERICELEGKVE